MSSAAVLAGSWASWKLRSKLLSIGLRHPLIPGALRVPEPFGPPSPRWGEEGWGTGISPSLSNTGGSTLMMVLANAAGDLFSPAGRRWPEGPDEGGASQ
jgi:hypothetical protein